MQVVNKAVGGVTLYQRNISRGWFIFYPVRLLLCWYASHDGPDVIVKSLSEWIVYARVLRCPSISDGRYIAWCTKGTGFNSLAWMLFHIVWKSSPWTILSRNNFLILFCKFETLMHIYKFSYKYARLRLIIVWNSGFLQKFINFIVIQ